MSRIPSQALPPPLARPWSSLTILSNASLIVIMMRRIPQSTLINDSLCMPINAMMLGFRHIRPGYVEPSQQGIVLRTIMAICDETPLVSIALH
jgi:hypothetical protein